MSDPTTARPGDDAQFLLVCMLFLDGQLKADQLARFNSTLLESGDRRRLFVDMCLLQTRLNEEYGVFGTRPGSDLSGGRGNADRMLPNPPDLGDTMILPAIMVSNSLAASNDDQTQENAHPRGPVASLTRSPIASVKRLSRFKAAAIIIIPVLCGYVAWTIRSKPAPASITATADVTLEVSDAAQLGTPLVKGQSLRLKSGSMEITFGSGAKVVLRGPSMISVDDENAMTLESGTMTAYAPPAASGFHVTAPGLSVVDLGTRFGIRCEADGNGCEVHIFQGVVNATLLDSTGHQLGDTTTLTAGQALQHDSRAAGPVAVKFAPETFDQDINAIRETVPTIGTGMTGQLDGPDAYWQLLSAPGEDSWKPRPALILGKPYPTYEPNDAKAKWITKEGIGRVPAGEYVYRTHIDLSGFNPGTVTVAARISADNFLKDIIVNGVRTGVTTPAIKGQEEFASTVVNLPPARWHSGVNEVDVVVMNTDFETPDLSSPTGLKLSWTVTASPIVRR